MATKSTKKSPKRSPRKSITTTLDLRRMRSENLAIIYFLTLTDATLPLPAIRAELLRRGYIDSQDRWTELARTAPVECECGQLDCPSQPLIEELRDHFLVWDGRETLNDVLDIDTRNFAPDREVARA